MKNNAEKLVYFWLPVVLWCSIIFYLSSIPNLKTELGGWDLVLRKGAHMTEYGILFILCRRAVAATFIQWKTSAILLSSMLFSILYAVSDEVHQAFVPTRGPSLFDVCIDASGVILAYLIIFVWGKKYVAAFGKSKNICVN